MGRGPGAPGWGWDSVVPSLLLHPVSCSKPCCPRQSFVMVKGAALLLPAEEPLVAEPPPAAPPGRQEQHLQLMMQLLRPQDAIRLVGHGHLPRDGMGQEQNGDTDREIAEMRVGWGHDGDRDADGDKDGMRMQVLMGWEQGRDEDEDGSEAGMGTGYGWQ